MICRTYVGTPCKRGHDGLRYLANNCCVHCNRGRATAERLKDPVIWRERVYASQARRRAKDPVKWWCSRRVVDLSIRAKAKGLPFDLDAAHLLPLCVERCPIFGTVLSYTSKMRGVGFDNDASVDRLRPDKGYVRGNVIVISSLANRIKQNVGSREIYAVANWMKEKGL